MHTRA